MLSTRPKPPPRPAVPVAAVPERFDLRIEFPKVEGYRVGQVERGVVERGERLGEWRLERAVDLHYVQMGHARRQVLAQHAKPAADLEHDVGPVELGRAVDHAEDVVVDQKVLAELAVGPDAELAQAAQAGLAGFPGLARLVAHHPNTRAALSSTR